VALQIYSRQYSLLVWSVIVCAQYYRLYTSASDGLSFNRLQNALLGYGGPTLLTIQSGSSIFGAFTASPWKESKDFYGNHDCFLYRLLPGPIAVYRPTGGGGGDHFMYCNSFARSRGYDQQAHGIGFGGTTDNPRLFLAESFDDCRAGSDDLTFGRGPLLSSGGGGDGGSAPGSGETSFEIDNLEVWGVGGTSVVKESLKARSLSRDIRSAAIQKARKVDKAAFLDDFKSGLIDSKAFAHRGQVQGREGCTAVEDDEAGGKNGYKYEK
jgi:TLD